MTISNTKKVIKLIEKLDSSSNELKYAVFDFDNTCIVNDIGEAVFAFLCENKLLKDYSLMNRSDSNLLEYHTAIFQHYYHLLDQNKIEEAYGFLGECLSGFSINEIKDVVKKTINLEDKTITKRNLFGLTINKGLIVRNQIMELFGCLNKKNIKIWIVSASPKYIVIPAFKIFFPDVKAMCIGMENVIKNDLITTTLVYPLSTFEGKVSNIQNKIHKKTKPILAVGDSINDKAMLEYAQLSIVVDRGNSLSEYAKKQKNWIFLEEE